ncbi:head-tail adaptor protein [Devosia sp. Leaf64]|uniref:head-tail adaptor protein n=1 Tax=Devosia sp. Leaf64 TaxID=1736229 RepID=UPI0007125796|nr:head-tail adaptor protein [Devosia sp. Leaf64]KQN72402.1 hypothetical protein ASE94_07770 [Devosia sp. Leaf64]
MLTGNFRHTIIVQRASETIAGGGKPLVSWADIHTLRAELMSSEAVEANADNGQRETTTIVFRTHFRPGITTADRVIHAGHALNIVKLLSVADGRGLELHCEVVK